MSNIVQKGSTTPFVAGLRTPPRALDLSRKGEQAITVRVELAEVWDAVRILVSPNKIDDLAASRLARDVSKKIEESLEYPGQIKVTVIRETRAVDYAR